MALSSLSFGAMHGHHFFTVNGSITASSFSAPSTLVQITITGITGFYLNEMSSSTRID